MDELKPSVKPSKKSLLRSSDDDDLSSSEDSEFSDLRVSYNANENVVTGKQETISLDSDIGNIMRLQKQLQSMQHQLDKEKSNRATVDNKRTSLENDNKMLNQKIETLNKDKRSLEQLKIELEAKLRTLQLNLTEEHERRKNAEMMANRSKEQMSRNDEQCKAQTAAKEKCEMMIRSLQVQLQTATAALQQMEKEKNEFQQKAFESQSALMVAQSPREAARRKDDIHSQLTLEKEKSESKEKIESLANENKKLQQMLNDMKNDLKLDEGTLAKTTLQYNVELGELKNENNRLRNLVDDLERNKSELERTQSQLKRTKSDLEETERRKIELERSLKDETLSLKDSLKLRDDEVHKVKGDHEMQLQNLRDTQLKLGKNERELELVSRDLQDKISEMSKVREELEKQQSGQKTLQDLNKQQKEDYVRQQVKLEALQEKVNKLQDEILKLNQNLDDERQKAKRSEELNLLITGRKGDQEKALHEIQSKNDTLSEKVEELKDKLEWSEHLKGTLEKDLETTREKLAEAQQLNLSKKIALDTDDRLKSELQSERDELLKKVNRLGQELEDAKTTMLSSDKRFSDLSGLLQKTEKDLAESNRSLKTKQEELQLAMRQLEQNNAKLKDVVAEEEIAQKQERERALLQENPNVTDFAKSGSRQGQNSEGHHSDALYSSDETTSAGKEGRRRRRRDSDHKSRADGYSRSRSDTDMKRNSAMETEVAKLKAQLRLAKTQLKPETPQWGMGYADPMQHLRNQSDQLVSKVHELQGYERVMSLNKMGADGYGDQLAEIEARIRLDLNSKLAAINQYLQEHADTCEKIDLMRERSTRTIRTEFNTLEKELQEELLKLKEAQVTAMSQRESKELDHEPLQLKDLYNSETHLAGHQGAGLHLKSSSTTGLSAQPAYNTEHVMTDFCMDPHGVGMWPLRRTLTGLPFSIRQQLERSINKHLEKAPQLNIKSLHQDHVFTVADTLDRSSHGYASALKRNYLIT